MSGGKPALEAWQVDHGTPGGEKWHYRHGEKPCAVCRDARNEQRRQRGYPRYAAVHADRGDGVPRCGHRKPHAVDPPGKTISCKRCQQLLQGLTAFGSAS